MTPCIVPPISVGELVASNAVGVASKILARPKSRTFTLPSAATLMLAGLRSR